MKFKQLIKILALFKIIVFSQGVFAEDIDLFLDNPGIPQSQPNILFMIDNSANWSATLVQSTGEKKYQAEHKALLEVLTDAGFTDKMRAGIMTFAHSNDPKGGKVIAAVKPLDSTYQNTLANMLYPNGIYVLGDEQLDGTNNAPYASSLNEAFLYFSGLAPKSGTMDGDHDPDALASPIQYASPAHDLNNACARNFIILVANGSPDSGENNYAEGLLTELGGRFSSDPISLSPDKFEANWGDEFARYMSRTDVAPDQDMKQNTIIHVIDVFDPDKENTLTHKGARSFLKSIAKQGKGRYFTAKTSSEIVSAIETILENEVLAIDNAFASTALPVSVNVRGTNLNQVYIGVFRPDSQKSPRWFGNLKLYQLAVDPATDTVFMADVNGLRVENPTTGFVVSDAISFWTHDSSFWNFDPKGTPLSGSDSPDGEIVEKGAAGQQLRENYSTSPRNLYTCTGSCSSGSLLSSTPFTDSNTNITQSALGATSSSERTDLINWVRGDDTQDENSDASTADVRSSIHGDVLHSRPAVINYNRTGNDDDIVTYYGANDGVFHAIKGGKTATHGYELWGFIPKEFFGKLKRLYDNTPIGDTYGPKPYFVDGSISVYQEDDNDDGKLVAADGDKVYVYLSMRRGGRLIYALDVSDPNAPKFLWKRDYSNTGYGELGQTWSEPKVTKINLDGTAKIVLIFGAGYDPDANDANPAGIATMGRGVFVVDALTGNVIWQAGPSPSGSTYSETVVDMLFSIPSDVTVINRDSDGSGYADRVYVGDTGGNLWRIDIGDTDPSNWKVHKLAFVGGIDANARKFLFPPDVVYDGDANGPYDAVLIGSGDREHPFDTTIVNRFYMFKDRKTGLDGSGQVIIVEGDLYDATANLIQEGTESEQEAAKTELLAAKGWYITLNPGEKVVSSSITVSGGTFFNTNQPTPPDSTSCSSLGIARNYVVNFDDAAASLELDGSSGLTTTDRYNVVSGGGLPPSPVPAIVEIDGKKHQAVISGIPVMTPPNTKLEVRKRVFWYKEME